MEENLEHEKLSRRRKHLRTTKSYDCCEKLEPRGNKEEIYENLQGRQDDKKPTRLRWMDGWMLSFQEPK